METDAADAGEQTREREARALAAVEAFRAAYEAGSAELFDLFTADASIFPLSSRARLRGRDAYRRYLGESLHTPPRATHLLRVEVDLVGENFLVTCLQHTRCEYRSSDSRVTLLLVEDAGRLKVAHLHMSPLASAPVDDDARGLVEEVLGLAGPAAAIRDER